MQRAEVRVGRGGQAGDHLDAQGGGHPEVQPQRVALLEAPNDAAQVDPVPGLQSRDATGWRSQMGDEAMCDSDPKAEKALTASMSEHLKPTGHVARDLKIIKISEHL